MAEKPGTANNPREKKTIVLRYSVRGETYTTVFVAMCLKQNVQLSS